MIMLDLCYTSLLRNRGYRLLTLLQCTTFHRHRGRVMSLQNLSPAFRDAAQYLSNATSLSQVSNAIKLELYGLYKFLTVSPTPNTSRPSLFDFTGRAKWDAWDKSDKTYGASSAQAEARYLEIARSLGWTESKVSAPPQDVQQTNEPHTVWDEELGLEVEREAREGSGMGNYVSVMARPELEDDKSLSGIAISGDAEGLKEFKRTHPSVSLNRLDENGYTPLHLACDRGHLAVVRLLLSEGADKDVKDADDMTAIELARFSGHDDIVQLLES
ncbi:ankyrin [Obba rivulosa]|uniref:Ankyrin n=1 Tax=Obba rivulosa TaxID=1052685 RepID=A0A8E2DSC0_9APHY|nr:ankyrin [Obba rivulosa]